MPLYQDNAFRGALVRKAANQSGANYSAATAVAWDAEEYDTDAIHDNVTDNSRLTVPAGVTRVRLGYNLRPSLVTSGSDVISVLAKNGSSLFNGYAGHSFNAGNASPMVTASSPVLTVTAGDYFTVLFQCSDTSIDLDATSNFWMEIIE